MSVHNGEKYLKGAIENIRNQIFASFGTIPIIINDGSIDSVKEILNVCSHKRLKIITQGNMALTRL